MKFKAITLIRVAHTIYTCDLIVHCTPEHLSWDGNFLVYGNVLASRCAVGSHVMGMGTMLSKQLLEMYNNGELLATPICLSLYWKPVECEEGS